MKEKTGKPISFRPYERVRKRLEQANFAGFDMSEIINTVLVNELDGYLRKNLDVQEDSMKKLRDALSKSAS